jgi:DNA-binding HxlR family transcriptional regulator
MSPRHSRELGCSVARTLDVLGDKWTLLVIRDAFYGLRRFEEFQRDLGIARNILTDRLNRLVERGILERRRYEERPPRDEYRLTAMGRDLFGVLMAMHRWGDTWLTPAGQQPPVRFIHRTCGEATHAQPACAHCGEVLDPRALQPDPVSVLGARIDDRLAAG